MSHRFEVGDWIVINTQRSVRGQTYDFDKWYDSKQPQQIVDIDEEGALHIIGTSGERWKIEQNEVIPAKGHIKQKVHRIKSWSIGSIK